MQGRVKWYLKGKYDFSDPYRVRRSKYLKLRILTRYIIEEVKYFGTVLYKNDSMEGRRIARSRCQINIIPTSDEL